MKEFLPQVQKIKATCIVRHENHILLLRSDQVRNREHRPQAGYFGLPSFTISFGESPEVTLEQALYEYFAQSVENLSMMDVRQYMSADNSVQIFELIYTATSSINFASHEEYGTFVFVPEDKLDAYMFPAEREDIERYL